MIKYKKKQSTLYGLAGIVSIFIEFNLFILMKIFKIENKYKLLLVNILVFIMFNFEIIFFMLILGRLDWPFNWNQLLWFFGGTVLLFFSDWIICRTGKMSRM